MIIKKRIKIDPAVCITFNKLISIENFSLNKVTSGFSFDEFKKKMLPPGFGLENRLTAIGDPPH
jgi:hypothetical protein